MNPPGAQGSAGPPGQLPAFLREAFSVAMSQSMLLPAFIALFGVVAALFMVGFAASEYSFKTMVTSVDD